jgi:hypothetical protein
LIDGSGAFAPDPESCGLRFAKQKASAQAARQGEQQIGTFSLSRASYSTKENKQAGNAIMTTNKSIKIIKRGERAALEAEAPTAVNEEKKSARDVVATVTEWVNEFQQKRRTETSQALKTLFGETTPQPTKA